MEEIEAQKIEDKLLRASELSYSYRNKLLLILDKRKETLQRAEQEYSLDPQYSTKIDKACMLDQLCIETAAEATVVKLFGSVSECQYTLSGFYGSGLATMLIPDLGSAHVFSFAVNVSATWKFNFMKTFKSHGITPVLETTTQNDHVYEVLDQRERVVAYQIPKRPVDHTTRYDWQSVLIMEDVPVVREAATFLYEKHPAITSVYILENQKPKLIKGEAVPLSEDSRLVLVGHGTKIGGETRLGGYKAEEVADIISHMDRNGDQIKTISVVACECGSDKNFMSTLMKGLQGRSIETKLHLRSSLLQVSHTGKKITVEITPEGLVRRHHDYSKKVVVQLDNSGEVIMDVKNDYKGEDFFSDEHNFLIGDDDLHGSAFVQLEAQQPHTSVLEDFSQVIFSRTAGKLKQPKISAEDEYVMYDLELKWEINRHVRINSVLINTEEEINKVLINCYELSSAVDIQNIVTHYGNFGEVTPTYLMLHDWIYLVLHQRLYVYPVGKRLSMNEKGDEHKIELIKAAILEHDKKEQYRFMRDAINSFSMGKDKYVDFTRQTFLGEYVAGMFNDPSMELWFTTYFVASVISESSRNFRTFPVTLMALDLAGNNNVRDTAIKGLLEYHPMATGGSWIDPKSRGFGGSSYVKYHRYRTFDEQLRNLKAVTRKEEAVSSLFYAGANSEREIIIRSAMLYNKFKLTTTPNFEELFVSAKNRRLLKQRLRLLGGSYDDVSYQEEFLATEAEHSLKLSSYYSHLSHKITEHIETQLKRDFGEEFREMNVKPESVQIRNGEFHCQLKSKGSSKDIEWVVTLPEEEQQLMAKLGENMRDVSEMKLPEPSEIHRTPENLERMGKAVGTLGLMLGMQGAVHAFERGDIKDGVIGTLQTTQGITEISLTAVAKASVTSELHVLKTVKTFMESPAGKKTPQVMPVVGIGFGIYNVEEDFNRNDALGYIDGVLDSSILAIDVVETVQPELAPFLAPISLGISILRMANDDVYMSIEEKLENLPPDAGTLDKIGAVIKGVGEGIVHFAFDVASFFYTIPYHEIEEGNKLVQRISDYHKYYTFPEVQDGRKAIDFSSGDASWNAGSITFTLHERDSDLCMDSFVSYDESLQKRCWSIKTHQTKDIVLGTGESHKLTYSSIPLKVLLFIPAGHETVVSGYEALSHTRYGTYYGNDQDNHFFAAQANSDAHVMEIMLSYYYNLYGNAGADIFYLGPQRSYIEGQSGKDTYVIPGTGGNTNINNYDNNKATDSLIFSVNYTDISVTKSGNDLVLHYFTDHKVQILNWFVGEQYQHINLMSADGVLFEISPIVMSSVELIALGVNKMSKKQGQKVNASEPLLLSVTNIMGSPHDDFLIGNNQKNVIDGGGGVDYMKGGEGEDIYVVKEREDSRVDIENHSHDNGMDMVIIEAELHLFRVKVDGDNLILRPFVDINALVTLINWFRSEADRHLVFITKDLVTFTISEKKDLCNQSDPFRSKCILSQSIDYRKSKSSLQVDLGSDDAFQNVTQVYGSKFSDSIIGNANRNTIVPGQGKDFLKGLGGEDWYIVIPGQGLKIIDNNSPDLAVDTLFLKERYTYMDCRCDGGDMFITINSTNEVLLKNWFKSSASQHLQIQSSDGITFQPIHNNNQCNNPLKIPQSVDHRNERLGQTMNMNREEFASVVEMYGSSGFDVMVGNNKDNTLDPYTGGGRMIGTEGSDTYVVKPQRGVTLEIDNFARDGRMDTVLFNVDFLHSQISVRGDESDVLVITMVEGEETQVRLLNYSGGQHNQHLSFQSLDGVFFRVRSPIKNSSLNQQAPWIEAYKVKLLNSHVDCRIDLNSLGNLSNVHTVQGCPQQPNHIMGNQQDNAMFGGVKDDTLEGGPGHDTLMGGKGNDIIMGNSGNDTMYGEEGDDLMLGGSGPDVFIPGPGADEMDGGSGRDTVLYQGDHKRGEGVYVNLLAGEGLQADAEGDVLKDIENVIGTIFSDILISGYEPSLLKGSDGDDVLVSVVGDDYLIGGEGKDIYLLISKHGLLTINNCAEDKAMDILYLRFLSIHTLSCLQTSDWLSLTFRESESSVVEVRLMEWHNTAHKCGHLTLILKEGVTSVEKLVQK